MKFYLSSYKLGNKTDKLKQLVPHNTIGYIPNARDFSSADPDRRKTSIASDIQSLKDLGFECELIDLKDYFDNPKALKEKLQNLGAVFIGGGNVFVLRQAMKLSGFDKIMTELQNNKSFLYAGYSAAGCVLSPKLDAYQIVDDPTDTPYSQLKEVIWDGLGLIDYAFLPHYNSDHPESKAIDKEVQYCKEHNIAYKTLRDGEVIIIE